MSLFSLSKPARLFLKRQVAAQPVLVALILGMSLITAVLEMMGVALVFPLLMVIIRPQSLERYPWAIDVMGSIGVVTQREIIIFLLIAIAVIMVLKNVYMGVFHLVRARVFAKWKSGLSSRLMNIYLYSDFSIHMEKNSSEIIRNLSLAGIVFDQFISALFLIMVNVLVAGGLVFVLSLVLPMQTAFGVAVLLVTATILYFVMRKHFARIGQESNELYRIRQQLMQQSIGAIKEAKVLGKEKYFISQYTAVEQRYFGRQGFYNFLSSIPVLVVETMIIMSMLALVTHVLFIAKADPEILATLGLLAAAMFRLAPMINRILTNLQLMNLGENSLEIIAREIGENEDRIRIPKVRDGDRIGDWNELEMRNVSYCYPDGTLALKNINLKIKRNEFVGMTGPSGGGKSTLLMVLLGLLEPTEGEMLVDGEALTDPARLRKWQNAIGYVPQGLFLIDGPMLNNIAYCATDDELDEERVVETVKLVHLSDYVASQSNGLHESVGENGNRLSGGQKQRVVIARALYRDPDLLAFDEATSALDANIERAITDSLSEFKASKTIVAIAHKLTTLRNCDQILMLDEGRILGFDSFEGLEKNCPEFNRLVKLSSLQATVEEAAAKLDGEKNVAP